jgi:hypothetical protein
VEGDISVDNEVLLVTDFVTLKIKSVQFFKNAHKDNVCMHVFLRVSAHTYV